MAAIIISQKMASRSFEAQERLNEIILTRTAALIDRVDEISKDWIVQFVQDELLKNGGELVEFPLKELIYSPSSSGFRIKPIEIGEKKPSVEYRNFTHLAIKFNDSHIFVPDKRQEKVFSEDFVSSCLQEVKFFSHHKPIELASFLNERVENVEYFIKFGIKFECLSVYKLALGLPNGHVDLLSVYFEALLTFNDVEKNFCLQTIPVKTENSAANYKALWRKNVFLLDTALGLEPFTYKPIPKEDSYKPCTESIDDFKERMSKQREELENTTWVKAERERIEKERRLRLDCSSSFSGVKPQLTRSGHSEDVFKGFASEVDISPIENKPKLKRNGGDYFTKVQQDASLTSFGKNRKSSKSSPSRSSSKLPSGSSSNSSSRTPSKGPSSRRSSINHEQDDNLRKKSFVLNFLTSIGNYFFPTAPQDL